VECGICLEVMTRPAVYVVCHHDLPSTSYISSQHPLPSLVLYRVLRVPSSVSSRVPVMQAADSAHCLCTGSIRVDVGNKPRSLKYSSITLYDLISLKCDVFVLSFSCDT
jgi:hypothetical protein